MQVLRLCRKAGLVKLWVVALAANRSYATIEEEVHRMLKGA